jgi:hypothetical protein
MELWPYKKRKKEFSPSPHTKCANTQQEGRHLQVRKRDLTRTWLWWNPDLRLPDLRLSASKNVSKCLFFMLPSRWHYFMVSCVSQISVASVKHLRKSTWRKKCLLWLMVLDISVHGQLVPLLLGLWWGRTSWQGACGRTKQRSSPHEAERLGEGERKS